MMSIRTYAVHRTYNVHVCVCVQTYAMTEASHQMTSNL